MIYFHDNKHAQFASYTPDAQGSQPTEFHPKAKGRSKGSVTFHQDPT